MVAIMPAVGQSSGERYPAVEGKTLANAVETGGLATLPPFSGVCANPNCRHAFVAFSPRARFCCGDCRTAHWKDERKRAALVQALVERFRLADIARALLVAAVAKAAERFYAFAEWLGLTYRAKRYRWETL